MGVSVGIGEGVGDGSWVGVGGTWVGVAVGSAGDNALQPAPSSAATNSTEIILCFFMVLIPFSLFSA
jgi:hypothetical protein